MIFTSHSPFFYDCNARQFVTPVIDVSCGFADFLLFSCDHVLLDILCNTYFKRTEGYERNVFVKVICCTRAFEAVYKIRNDSSAPKIFMSHTVQKVQSASLLEFSPLWQALRRTQRQKTRTGKDRVTFSGNTSFVFVFAIPPPPHPPLPLPLIVPYHADEGHPYLFYRSLAT